MKTIIIKDEIDGRDTLTIYSREGDPNVAMDFKWDDDKKEYGFSMSKEKLKEVLKELEL